MHCVAMAFADDFIVLDEEEVRVPNTLAEVEGFFAARGVVNLGQRRVQASVSEGMRGSLSRELVRSLGSADTG